MHAIRKGRMLTRSLIAAGIAAALGGSAFGQSSDVEVQGYLRGYAGWNVDKIIELGGERGDLNMLRGQVYLEAQNKKAALQWKLSARVAREAKVDYLKDLQKLERTVASPYGNPAFSVSSLYDRGEIRDLWVQFQPLDNLNVKIGRQQVVWGETDLFQALDIIHGYNFLWAPLLEEPDEMRKPLFLFNTVLTFPEANGSAQLILRPGWDALRDNGSTWDVYGGRGRTIGFKGGSSALLQDYEHPEGDLDNKLTYALRWKGLAAGLNYHLSYVKMPYTRNPVANSALAPYKQGPVGGILANWIVPIVEVYAAGANAYVQELDTVLTGEVIATRGEPFNIGSAGVGLKGPVAVGCLNAALGPGVGMAPFLTSFSGLCGIKRKDTLMTMIRAEKSLKTHDILGTSSPMTAALQIFNTRISGFNRAEELVQGPGYPNLVKENSTFVSLVLRAPFMQDKLTPTVALGRDFTNDGSLFAIAVDYELGTHWRLRAELDKFWGNSTVTMQNTPMGYMAVGSASGMSGMLDDSSRFVLRVTYQF